MPPQSVSAPVQPASVPPRPAVDLASQQTVRHDPPIPSMPPEQRRQLIAIVLMLGLAAGMGFLVLGLGMLL